MTIFDTALERIRGEMNQQAEFASNNLTMAAKALDNLDVEIASQVEDTTDQYEEMFAHFQEDCFKTLALHHPVASDLMNVMSVFKTGQDIERINSLIERIARKTRKFIDQDSLKIPDEIRQHVSLIIKMLGVMNEGLKANNFANDRIAELESESNSLKKVTRRAVEEDIKKQPERARSYMLLLGISRHLDRIAKLVGSVAEGG